MKQKQANKTIKSDTKRFIVLMCFVISMVFLNLSQAHAVKIIPPRLVIDPDTKIEHMWIKNNSDTKEIYRFGWNHIGMNKEGKVINLDKFGMDKAPGYKAADDFIRFSPRRAILEPGQTQRITFMLRRSPEMEAGEYRSHFLVQREPRAPEPVKEGENAGKPLAGSPSVKINVVVSRSVPIYVLHGETNAHLTLLRAELKKNPNRTKKTQPEYLVYFDVQKTGNRSVIGLANVFCQKAGEDVRINKASKAFAVYAEGEFRKEQMAIQMPKEGCKSMKIVIKGHPNDVLAGEVLGEQAVKR